MSQSAPDKKVTPDAAAIEAWLVEQLADRLHLDPGAVDPRAPLTRYGIDSAEAASLAYELEQWLGRELFPSDIIGAGSISDLAARLALATQTGPEGEGDEGS